MSGAGACAAARAFSSSTCVASRTRSSAIRACGGASSLTIRSTSLRVRRSAHDEKLEGALLDVNLAGKLSFPVAVALGEREYRASPSPATTTAPSAGGSVFEHRLLE